MRTSLPGVRGRKPRKQKALASSPLADSAATSAEGPGIGVTACPCCHAARTRCMPGSLRPEDVASPQYANTARLGTVAGWLNDPLRRHRAAVLVRAVAAWLDTRADVAA